MSTLIRPAEYAENQLIDGILSDTYPINSELPAERQLAAQLGITRPTLREALQRLQRDGWVEIRQGKPTRVRNFWQEGNLAVLAAIAQRSPRLPAEFIPNLLEVRVVLAPEYTRLAVQKHPEKLLELLHTHHNLQESPEIFARFDWELHHRLTVLSGNAVYTLILNGFKDLYLPMACLYFSQEEARQHSRRFYLRLEKATQARDERRASQITRQVMKDSLSLWQKAVELNGNTLNPVLYSEEVYHAQMERLG